MECSQVAHGHMTDYKHAVWHITLVCGHSARHVGPHPPGAGHFVPCVACTNAKAEKQTRNFAS